MQAVNDLDREERLIEETLEVQELLNNLLLQVEHMNIIDQVVNEILDQLEQESDP